MSNGTDHEERVLHFARKQSGTPFTAQEFALALNISEGSARSVLRHFVDLELFERLPISRATYRYAPNPTSGLLKKVRSLNANAPAISAVRERHLARELDYQKSR